MSDAAARPSTARAAYALSFGLLVGGISLPLGVVTRLRPIDTGVRLWPAVIVVLTLLFSASAITLQFRRQAHTLSMTEVPVAIGLFALSPVALVVAKAL